MGLLDKHNPDATRKSVIRWAWGGGVAGFLAGLGLVLYHSNMPAAAWYIVLPWMTVGGAVTGGAIEWQVPRD
ncbi:MAG TPA: hypothetical protein VFG68_05335 [Fimbriiglobus sp.]|nr:hypothetical protein [Fimbriiglobus sp.]